MRWMRLILGIFLLITVIVTDRAFNDMPFFEEWPPDWSVPFLLRSLVLASATFMILTGTRAVLIASVFRTGGKRTPDSDVLWLSFAAIAGIVLSLIFAGMVSIAPTTLAAFAEEDYIVEWASALFAFIAGLLVLIAAVRQYKAASDNQNRVATIILLGLSGLLILLGLEEVSWFQRVFDLPTPSLFDSNRQKEINLHNFATVATANAYFVGACLFCIVLPYLFAGRELPSRFALFAKMIPTRAVLYGSVYACAITYKMWNVIPIQMTFWLGLVAIWTDQLTVDLKYLRWVTTAVMIVTLIAFHVFGHNMGRSLDAEVREMIIPFGLLLYAMGLVQRQNDAID